MVDKRLVEAVIWRLSDWPKEACDDLWKALDEIEQRHDLIYHLTDEERADLEQALKEVEEGLFASEEEVKAVFDLYR